MKMSDLPRDMAEEVLCRISSDISETCPIYLQKVEQVVQMWRICKEAPCSSSKSSRRSKGPSCGHVDGL